MWRHCNVIPRPRQLFLMGLTHWGQAIHIYVSKLTIIGSDNNGLSPGRHQAIIWTNDGILLIGSLGTNFSEILIEMYTLPFKKMHSILSRPQCVKTTKTTEPRVVVATLWHHCDNYLVVMSWQLAEVWVSFWRNDDAIITPCVRCAYALFTSNDARLLLVIAISSPINRHRIETTMLSVPGESCQLPRYYVE